MAEDRRRPTEEVLQGILLDDPGLLLKEIVKRVLQEMLKAQKWRGKGYPKVAEHIAKST